MNRLSIPCPLQDVNKVGIGLQSILDDDMLRDKGLCLSASRMRLNVLKDFLPPSVLAFAGVSAAAICDTSFDLYSPSDAMNTLLAWKYFYPLSISIPFKLIGMDNGAKFDNRLLLPFDFE
jgi:hypothetical protein